MSPNVTSLELELGAEHLCEAELGMIHIQDRQPAPQPSVSQLLGDLSGWAVTEPQPCLERCWVLLPWEALALTGSSRQSLPLSLTQGLQSWALLFCSEGCCPGRGASVQHSNVTSSSSVQPSFLGPASHSCQGEQQYRSLLCLVSLLGQDVSVAGIAWI